MLGQSRACLAKKQLFAVCRAISPSANSDDRLCRVSGYPARPEVHARSKRSCAISSTRATARPISPSVWGVSLRYDLGGNHPLVGRSAPDFELVDGTKLGELMRAGKGLLLDFDGSQPLQAIASRWSGRIAYVASDVKDRLGLSSVLMRADGFIAWAGEATPDLEEAARAASRWFGEPQTRGSL